MAAPQRQQQLIPVGSLCHPVPHPLLSPRTLSPWVEPAELVNPTGLKGPAESILELDAEINCFAGYKAQNVLRDEKKILCVFLAVKESGFWPGLGWGPGDQGSV